MKRMFPHAFGGFWRMVVLDFWRKLLALFLALLLYGAVNYRFARSEPMRLAGVPVEVMLPDGVVNVDQRVPPVEVTVAGSARIIKVISSRDIQARIRIPEGSFVPGMPYELKLSPADFKLPAGVEILEVEPREILLNLEPLITRKVPVEIKFDSIDRLSPDYKIDRVSCAPTEVSVSGPASKVNELRTIATRPIPLDQTVTDSFDYGANLRPVEDIKISPVRVAARIEIARKYSSRSFRNLSLQLLLPPDKQEVWQVELPKSLAVEVAVTGPESVLGTLQNVNLRPFLDLGELREPGTFDLAPGCMIVGANDAEVQVRMIRPDRITVKVRSK